MSDALAIPTTWSFDAAGVAENFDRHVAEQLPFYPLVTRSVVHIARHYIGEGSLVYDIGASTGNIGRAMAPILEERAARLVSIECSDAMASLWKAPGELKIARAETFDYQEHDFAVMFLVLMFVAPAKRRELIDKVLATTSTGGALVVVDRTVAARGYPATVMWRLALAEKLQNGAPPKEIIDKELSLSGIQRPLDPTMLPDNAVEFMRFGDFAGWIIERPET